MKKILVILLIIVSINGYSQSEDFIVGNWHIKSKNMSVEIKKQNGKYVGYITKSAEQANVGKKVIWGLSFASNSKEWTDGTLQLPEMNHSASCYILFKSNSEVSIVGYHGLKMFGKKVVATRI